MFLFWSNVLVTGLLIYFTYLDIRYRQILWPAAAVTAAAGILLHLACGVPVPECVWGIIPGGILLAISFFFREAVGKGDSYTLSACGAVLGFSKVCELLLIALFFSAAWSVLLMVRKRDGRQSFAFMPFLLAAQICRMAG